MVSKTKTMRVRATNNAAWRPTRLKRMPGV
jgi:hypothetical protein